jgi:hypothetical protein
MADEAGPSNAGGSGGGDNDSGWRGGGRRHSAPVAQRATTRQSTAEAEASAQRSTRPFGRSRRQVPDAPRDQTEVLATAHLQLSLYMTAEAGHRPKDWAQLQEAGTVPGRRVMH